MCKFRRKKQLVIKSCVQLRRVIRNFTFFFQWSQFIIIIGNRAVFTWLSKGIGFGFGFGFTHPRRPRGSQSVFKHRRKSPWVPTLTGPFPNGQVNAVSWLGTKNALYYCAKSGNSISWVLFVSSYTTRQLLTRSRLVWLMHQRKKCTQSGNFQFDINTLFQNTGWLSLH